MSLRVTGTRMDTDGGYHARRRLDGRWVVSWLPGRALDRNTAITALTLAESVTALPSGQPSGRTAVVISVWASELELDPRTAVRLIRAATTNEGQER